MATFGTILIVIGALMVAGGAVLALIDRRRRN